MPLLPDPPPALPAAPRAFYDELRALLIELAPADVDHANVEVDFGDAGVAVTLPHARQPDWTLAAQVSIRAAVVFAGPDSAHFDDRDPAWTSAAVACIAEVLRGEREVVVAHRGRAFWRVPRTETVRITFGARR